MGICYLWEELWRIKDIWISNIVQFSLVAQSDSVIGRTDVEAETPILWLPDAKNWLIWKDPDAGKDWRQEEKGTTEDEMVGWHHQLNGHQFVRLFATPWTAVHQASLSITNFQSLLKLVSIELVMPSNHLIFCCPLLLLPSIFPGIRVFSNESVLRIR